MMTKVKEAFDALRQIRGAKVFKSSFSSSLKAYDKDTVISRLEMWCAWHSAWVYDEEPTFRWTDPMFPLPGWMNRVDPLLFTCPEYPSPEPEMDESILPECVISPVTDLSSVCKPRETPLTEAQVPSLEPMDTDSSEEEGYANRFCESDSSRD